MNIIQDLINFTEAREIDTVLHFGDKPSHVALRIDSEGKFIRADIMEDSPVRVPWPVPRTNNTDPDILFGEIPCVLAVHEKADRREKIRKELREGYAALLAMQPKHQGLVAATAFVNREHSDRQIETITKAAKEGKAKNQSRTLVFYLGDKKRPICEDPKLRNTIERYQREVQYQRTEMMGPEGEEKECILRVHHKVRPRGLGHNQSLVSYDKPVTWMLPGSTKDRNTLHGHMDYDMMRRYSAALEWIVRYRYISTPTTSGRTLSYYGWTTKEHRIESIVQAILYGRHKDQSIEDWRDWLRTSLDEDKELFEDDTPYHLLGLLCSQRIAVRSYSVMPCKVVASRIKQYLDDFYFEDHRGVRRRSGLTPYRVFQNIYPEKKDGLPIVVVERFYDALFGGTAYDRETFERASKEWCAGNFKSLITGKEVNTYTFRVFMNAYQERKPMKMNKAQEVLFNCGALFGVIRSRAYAAKDTGDRPSVEKEIEQCAKAPRVVLGRLLARTFNHEVKLLNKRSVSKQNLHTYGPEIAEYMGKIFEGDDVPMSVLDKDLMFFMAGFYEWERTRRQRYQEHLDQMAKDSGEDPQAAE